MFSLISIYEESIKASNLKFIEARKRKQTRPELLKAILKETNIYENSIFLSCYDSRNPLRFITYI